MEITPEQATKLKTWASERDSILFEIAKLKEEKEKITKDIIELSQSKTEIQNDIVKSEGRMEELDKKEKLYEEIVSIEIPKLEVQKTKLETEVMSFQKEVSYLDLKKDGLVKDIDFLIKTQKDVFERTGVLEKVVEHVTKISSSNIKELDEAVAILKKKVDEILKLSTEDIDAHNRILGEIPKLFVELQRKSLIREKI